jgi:hypothetical protein
MVINRKNDGTVKMTRQSAKRYHSGMTGGNETLFRYLTAEKKTPKEVTEERLRETAKYPYHRKVLYRKENQTMVLMFYGNEFYLRLENKEQASAIRSTVVWDSKDRALLALTAGKVIWKQDV